MLERLTGRFKEIREYGDTQELARILSELRGGRYRIHIYDESGKILIAYLDPGKETMRVIGLDHEERPAEPPRLEGLSKGYVEVFEISEEGARIDEEVLRRSAELAGTELGDVIEELPYPEALPPQERRAGGLAGVIRDFSDLISEELSTALTKPSGIAKVILASEEYVFRRLTYEEVLDLLRNYSTSKRFRYIAIKLVAGDNVAWIIKLGDRVGIALLRKGEPVLWGSTVADRAERVEEYVKRVVGEVGFVDVHVYVMPESFVI